MALLGLGCDSGEELTPCAPDCEGAACAACVSTLPEEALRPALTCDQLPAQGRCLGPRVLERCEGGVVHREDCGVDSACVETPGGRLRRGRGVRGRFLPVHGGPVVGGVHERPVARARLRVRL